MERAFRDSYLFLLESCVIYLSNSARNCVSVSQWTKLYVVLMIFWWCVLLWIKLIMSIILIIPTLTWKYQIFDVGSNFWTLLFTHSSTGRRDGSENISVWRSIIIPDTLGERFWKQQFHDVCREWSSEKMRGLISCRAVTADPRGNDHLFFLNSSHLANWEHLRAPELKVPSGSTLDNQWPCPKRGRMEVRAPRSKADKPFHFQDKETENTLAHQSFLYRR